MKKLVLVAMLAMLPGCATMKKVAESASTFVDQVQTVVQDAQTIVNTLKAIETIFFLAHPMPDAQIRVEKAFVAVEQGLNVAVRALSGAEKLTQEQFDLAFVEFTTSYRELVKLITTVGVIDGVKSGAYGVAKLPDAPLAMTYKVK
jgi:prophage DNA circulation protein